MKKIIFLLITFGFIGAVAFAGGNSEDTNADKGTEMKKVVIAVDSTWPPMEFIDTEKDEIVGFTIDLVRAIAQAEGFSAEFQTTAWDGIFVGLLKGDYDMIASSVTITEERKKKMAFSDPYFNAGQILVVRKEDASKFPSLQAMVGEEVGAQIATVGADEISKVDGVILKSYDALGPAVEELANGTISGIVADTPLVAEYMLKNERYADKFVTVGEPMTTEEYGFVFPPENQELREKINRGLATVKSNGVYNQVYSKWIN